jgi:hypothetical protein
MADDCKDTYLYIEASDFEFDMAFTPHVHFDHETFNFN